MKTPKQFYKELGADKLASRKLSSYTKKELVYLEKLLNKNQKILDLACGYGRFTIPLASKGYNIQGLDISPELIAKAKDVSKKEKIDINFQIGDMRQLPYENNSFDSIICMWSAFLELSEEEDQLKAMQEMIRIIKRGGLIFLEMSKPEESMEKTHIPTIEGIEGVPMYRHNEITIQKLIDKICVSKSRISIEDFGGRDRLLVFIWK